MKATNSHPQTDLNQIWGITELAAHLGITTRTIRFYEDKGLISPERDNGVRVFDMNDKNRIEKILRAKRIGFSLENIKHFMDVHDGEVKSKAELISRKTDFKRVIAHLERKSEDIHILVRDMRAMCAAIDAYIQSAPDTRVFEFADAYQDAFNYLDEGFIPV